MLPKAFTITRLALILSLAAFIGVVGVSLNNAAKALIPIEVPTPQQLERALVRVGLDPAHLAAAGVNSGEVSTTVDNVSQYLNDNQGIIEQADQAYSEAKAAYDPLKRKVQQIQATPDEFDQFSSLQDTLTLANNQRALVISNVRSAGFQPLDQMEVQLISTMIGNSQWKLPLPYLAVDRTEEEWVALRDALANEKIASEYGEEPDPEAQVLLNQVRSDPTFTLVEQNLQTNLDAVASAWQQAIGE